MKGMIADMFVEGGDGVDEGIVRSHRYIVGHFLTSCDIASIVYVGKLY